MSPEGKKKKKIKKVKKSDESKNNDFSVPKKYNVLLDKLKNLDVSKVYEKLDEQLRIDEKRMNRSALLKALNDASDNAKNAGYLMVLAKKERDRLELQKKEICGAMELDARRALTQMKKDKKFDGQITIDMVESHCLNKFKDYRKVKEEFIEIKRIATMLEVFYEQWKGRTSILQTITKVEKDGPSNIEMGETA